MKKICIGVLIFISFGISVYLIGTNTALEETKYGAVEVILFSMPFTMILVNSTLFFLPTLLRSNELYARYKKGLENIFLSLSLILMILHLGLILLVTGTDINLMLLIPICVGIVLITTANTLPRFQVEISPTSSEFTQSTYHAWNIIVRPFSLPLYMGGSIMLFCVFLPGSLLLIGFFSILFCTLLVAFYFSYRAYQTHLTN
ncbi:hypothetical protein ACFSCX_15560 [Bacillus salitolerans]|uniref:Uncharacterized protein n=1 Tax=Bacillus salitolerans TaxID=1437434 RepID=A0ABW4LV18_9BACI